MSRTVLIAASLLWLLAAPTATWADVASTRARVAEISNLVPAAAYCGDIGYRVAKIPDTGDLLSAEAAASGLPLSQLQAWFEAAQARDAAELEADQQMILKASEGDQDDPDFGTNLRLAAEQYARHILARCERAANDPAFGKIVAGPPPGGVRTAKRDLMDMFLAPAGQASFQPPEAQARGDLLYAAGVCHRVISPADARLYQGDILAGPEPTEPAAASLRRWYAQQYQDGLDRDGRFSGSQCAEMLPRLAKALKTPGP